MYKFLGKPGKMYFLDLETTTMKLNYNCPDSEKNGTGPGSCTDFSKQENVNDNNNYFLDDDNNKILEVPQINEKIYDDAIKSQDDLDSASGTRNINYYTSHSKKDIIDYNNSLSFNEYKALHENWVGTGWSNVPRGTSCAPTSIVNTEFLGEREWTLPRETSFKVTKNFIDKETGITYLDVDVVLDKKNKKV